MEEQANQHEVSARDRAVVAGELGRPPYELTAIAVRCPFGYPAVVETAPVVGEGSPNPTLLYMTCPTLAKVVSRAESAGAVKRLRSYCQGDPDLASTLHRLTQLYRERRATLVKGRRSRGPATSLVGAGIGGPERPEVASCLHAYAAAMLAVLSGWLDPGVVERHRLASSVQQIWRLFLPPVEECWCQDAHCARWDTEMRRAAIDVGTISVRLLVADVVRGEIKTLVRRAEVTRLGQGLGAKRRLGAAAKRRTAAAVARFAAEARDLGVETLVLAATSAARDASDGEEFIYDLGREHALIAGVLTGEREAELTYMGVSSDLRGELVVLDIGGGSTELTRKKETGLIESVSIDLGASRATEKWLHSNPPHENEVREAYAEAAAAFGALRSHFAAMPVEGHGPQTLVGVAGTVTTLACLDAGLRQYDPLVLHHRVLHVDSVRRLLAMLVGMSTHRRAALPGMQRGRAAVLPGGAVILLAAMETLGYEQLVVSERDLLEGLVLRGL